LVERFSIYNLDFGRKVWHSQKWLSNKWKCREGRPVGVEGGSAARAVWGDIKDMGCLQYSACSGGVSVRWQRQIWL